MLWHITLLLLSSYRLKRHSCGRKICPGLLISKTLLWLGTHWTNCVFLETGQVSENDWITEWVKFKCPWRSSTATSCSQQDPHWNQTGLHRGCPARYWNPPSCRFHNCSGLCSSASLPYRGKKSLFGQDLPCLISPELCTSLKRSLVLGDLL